MGNPYNPSDPCTVGCEWFPSVKGVTLLDSDQKAVGFRLTAATNDTIEQFWTFLTAAFGGYSVINLEVFDITAGLPALGALSTTTYYPSADIRTAAPPWTPGAYDTVHAYNPSAGGVAPWFQALASPSLTPFTWAGSGAPIANDALIFNYFGLGFDMAVGFGSVVGTQAGRWVTRVRSRAVCAQYLDLGASGAFTITPYLITNGVLHFGAAQSVAATQGPVEIFADWRYDPDTGAPWTVDKIELFEGVGGYGLGWVVQPTGSSNNLATILQGQLIVESAPSDPRLAIGSTIFPPGLTVGWREVLLRSPASWVTPTPMALAAGNDYLFLVRRGNQFDNLALPYLRDVRNRVVPAPPGWSSHYVLLDSTSLRPLALGAVDPAAYPVVLLKAASVVSLDSQPYHTISPITSIDANEALGTYYQNSVVNVDQQMRQEFTCTNTDDYGWIWLLVGQFSTETSADLNITIRTVAGDVAQGATAVITSADLLTPRRKWQRVGVRIPGAAPTLTAATQYYFDIDSTTSVDQSWMVQVLNEGVPELEPNGPPAGSSVASFSASVDGLTIGATPVEYLGMAACITLSTVPVIPADFAVTVDPQACCLSHAIVSWTATVGMPCGGFDSYEIQRQDAVGDWFTIAVITDVNVATVDDWEARRNRVSNYRMRVIRADGAPSDWTATETVTVPMTACVGLIFTSNASPELTLMYEDLAQERVFEFPEDVTEWLPSSQDGRVIYRELPDRLTKFKRNVRIRSGRWPCAPAGCDDFLAFGTDVFGPLKAIARAGLPYVCVLDEGGNRWYAFVKTPTGTWQQHGIEQQGGWAAYTMEIEVAELTNVPSPFDAVAGS